MRYVVTRQFFRSVRASEQRGADLARAVGLQPTHFSAYLRGTRFGERSAERLRAVGALVGLTPDACVEEFRDPLSNDKSAA